jgi:hypothetical protein
MSPSDISDFIRVCNQELGRLEQLHREPHSLAVAGGFGEVKRELTELASLAIVLGPKDGLPPVNQLTVKRLRDLAAAVALVQQLKAWAADVLMIDALRRLAADPGADIATSLYGILERRRLVRSHQLTREGREFAGLDPQAQATAGGVERRTVAPVVLTETDRRILAVLKERRRQPLTLAEIVTESIRLQRADRAKFKRVADHAVRNRVPVLEDQLLVARPQGTKRKGISITEAGLKALADALADAGNLPETGR